MDRHFFSLAEMKQPVNQWLCIAFIGVWCFWIVLYFMAQRAQEIGESYAVIPDLINNF